MTAHAQSNLPPCSGDYWTNCFGAYDFPSGNNYVGQWENNKKNGQGIFSWTFGDKYVGQWKDDKMNGQGTFTFPSGSKYVGAFKDGNYNGFGTLYNANGSIFQQGLWRDDAFVQSQTPPPVIAPVVPPVVPQVVPIPLANTAQDIKRQKCIRLGLVPGSADFQQCMN